MLLIKKACTLRKKCPYSELFWSECREIRTGITPNMDPFRAALIMRKDILSTP